MYCYMADFSLIFQRGVKNTEKLLGKVHFYGTLIPMYKLRHYIVRFTPTEKLLEKVHFNGTLIPMYKLQTLYC